MSRTVSMTSGRDATQFEYSGSCVKTNWTGAEDAQLLTVIKTLGYDTMKDKDWNHICQYMRNRNNKQCRERWLNHLNPELKKGEWTDEEDSVIESIQRIIGNHWAKIAKVVPGRTDNAIKNRYHGNKAKRQKRLIKVYTLEELRSMGIIINGGDVCQDPEMKSVLSVKQEPSETGGKTNAPISGFDGLNISNPSGPTITTTGDDVWLSRARSVSSPVTSKEYGADTHYKTRGSSTGVAGTSSKGLGQQSFVPPVNSLSSSPVDDSLALGGFPLEFKDFPGLSHGGFGVPADLDLDDCVEVAGEYGHRRYASDPVSDPGSPWKPAKPQKPMWVLQKNSDRTTDSPTATPDYTSESSHTSVASMSNPALPGIGMGVGPPAVPSQGQSVYAYHSVETDAEAESPAFSDMEGIEAACGIWADGDVEFALEMETHDEDPEIEAECLPAYCSQNITSFSSGLWTAGRGLFSLCGSGGVNGDLDHDHGPANSGVPEFDDDEGPSYHYNYTSGGGEADMDCDDDL